MTSGPAGRRLILTLNPGHGVMTDSGSGEFATERATSEGPRRVRTSAPPNTRPSGPGRSASGSPHRLSGEIRLDMPPPAAGSLCPCGARSPPFEDGEARHVRTTTLHRDRRHGSSSLERRGPSSKRVPSLIDDERATSAIGRLEEMHRGWTAEQLINILSAAQFDGREPIAVGDRQ